MPQKESGFAHHLLLVLLVVVLAVGGVGYYVWQRQKDNSIAAKAEGYSFRTAILDSGDINLKACRLGNEVSFLVDTESMSPAKTNLFVGFTDINGGNPSTWDKVQLGRGVYYEHYHAVGSYVLTAVGAELGSGHNTPILVSSIDPCN